MDNKSFDINSLRVASPCSVGWETMSGGERVRHCHACKLNIYNTAEMTTCEVQDLINDHEGRLCIRMYRRADGTVLTKDCPVGLRAVKKKTVRFAAAAFGAIVGLFSVSFGQKEDKQSINASKAGIVRTANEKRETELTGTVLDTNGAVVSGAKLKLFKIGGKKPFKTESNEEGIYRFEALKVGVYQLEVRSAGFKINKIVGIEVNERETISIPIFLEPGSITVTVGIFSDEPLIDTTSSSISTKITRRQIENLPR